MISLLTLLDLILTPLATKFTVLAKDGELMKGNDGIQRVYRIISLTIPSRKHDCH